MVSVAIRLPDHGPIVAPSIHGQDTTIGAERW